MSVDGENITVGSQQVDTLPAELTLAPRLYERLSSMRKSGVQIELDGLAPFTVSLAQDVDCTRLLSVVGSVALAGYPHQRIARSGLQTEVDYATVAVAREARVLVDLGAAEATVRSNPCYAAVDTVGLDSLPSVAVQIAAAAGPEARVVFEPRCTSPTTSSRVLSVWQSLVDEPALKGRKIELRAPSVCRAHQARVDQLGLDKPNPTADSEPPAADLAAAPPSSFRGSVRTTKLAVEGSGIGDADARAAVDNLGPRLLGCYAAGLARSSSAGRGVGGTLTVRVAIGSAGGVIDRPRGGGTLDDMDAVTCMSRTFATLTVPAAPRPITTIFAELTFDPG